MSNNIEVSNVPSDVTEVCRTLTAAGHRTFLVGGCVRDMAMGREPKDFDLATSAVPEKMMSLFGSKFAIPTGIQHGTVTVLSSIKRHVEVTTFRTDGDYLDGRRPRSVTFGKTLQEDLSRRDFTMNAIAFDPLTGELVDPFEGMADIEDRCVRAVGDPISRFVEDGLRVMRAVRQATQLDFRIDMATRLAISLPEVMESFKKVSAERVRDELTKILLSKEPARGIFRLRSTGLLEVMLPELAECIEVGQEPKHRHDVFNHCLEALRVAGQRNAGLVVRLAALLHDIGKPATRATDGWPAFADHAAVGARMVDQICQRLKFSNEERHLAVFLVANHEAGFETLEDSGTSGDVRRFIRQMGKERVLTLLTLRDFDVEAWWGEEVGTTWPLRDKVVACLGDPIATKDLAVNGKDIMEATGMMPGPRIGGMLEELLELVLDDPTLNTRETLLARAKLLLP